MPVNNISGSGSSNPVELFKNVQSNFQNTSAATQQPERTQAANQEDEVFTVNISPAAQEAAKLQQERQTEFEQDLQQDRDVQKEADRQVQQQRSEASDASQQQTIDVVV